MSDATAVTCPHCGRLSCGVRNGATHAAACPHNPGVIVGYSHTIAATGATAQASAQPAQARTWQWRFWQRKRAQPAQATTPAAVSAQESAQPAPQPDAEPAQLAAKPTRAQRLAHIREQEITDPAAIAARFRVSLRTAQMDLADVREAVTQTNGTGAAGCRCWTRRAGWQMAASRGW